jgi:hypothetical protein
MDMRREVDFDFFDGETGFEGEPCLEWTSDW